MSPDAYDFSTPTQQSIYWTKVYSGQQHWMDREWPHGPGIVREKLVHTETPGRVSRERYGEIEDNRAVSNQLSQTAVVNAKLIGSYQSRTLQPQEGNTSNIPWIMFPANSRILQWQSSNLQLHHAFQILRVGKTDYTVYSNWLRSRVFWWYYLWQWFFGECRKGFQVWRRSRSYQLPVLTEI